MSGAASAAGVLAGWAELLLDGLAASGVTDVVASPGSRSTPFVLAAARHPRLRVHDVIDERAAGFFALGLGRVTGRPALLLCTSGTAGAHYYPAVIEAAAAHVPLLVLTADRPFELMDCGAPQTIDQTRLFGAHVRRFVELGAPDAAPLALRALRRTAAQAALATRWPTPGPVHLNARARKPLEPAWDEAPPAARALAETPPPVAHPPRLAPDPQPVAALARACRRVRRGLLVAGPAPIAQAAARQAVAALAAATGFPLLAEAASQLRFGGPPGVGAFDALLRSPRFRERHAPELILQLGLPPTSSAWEPWLEAHPGAARVVIAPHGWPDPSSSAGELLVADIAAAAAALAAELGAAPPEPSPWAGAWAAADAAAWRAIDGELAAAERAGVFSELAAVRATVAALPAGGLLAVGNSLPIREVDAACPGALADVQVLSQRGANGIDGLVAGAAGAAAAAGGRPVTLLVGDVSFLHDVGGLAAARGLDAPLAIVVLHNDGGRLFEKLPVARAAPEAMGHFVTPHGLALEPAARLYGHRHRRVADPAALRAALAEAHAAPGCTVIEAIVPPDAAARQARVVAAVDRALEALP